MILKYTFLTLFAYLLVLLAFYIFQRMLIYYPTPNQEFKVERKSFIIGGKSINTVFLNRDSKKAIFYFGGNGEAVDKTAQDFSEILKDWNIYLLEYRSYGKSEGEPSEQRIFEDALFIYDNLKQNYKNIAVIGRSLGSGVATFLASKREIEKLILITPFDSIESVAKDRFPFLPVSLILKDKFDSKSMAKKIHSKTLIILAEDDKIVPKKHSQNLISSLKNAKTLKVVTIKNSTHNSLQFFRDYFLAIGEFLSGLNLTAL